MRKHSVRKWLHAILDLLPVIILPIFAIYSHRHTIDNYEITVSQNEVVDFNQLVTNGNFADSSEWFANSGDFTIQNNVCEFLATGVNGGMYHSISLIENHKYYFTVHVQMSSLSTYVRLNVYNDTVSGYDATTQYTNGTDLSQYLRFDKVSAYSSDRYFVRLLDSRTSDWDTIVWSNCMCVDLTQMFGVGNEPTIEQFITWYPNDYYEYNTGTKQLLKGVSTVTYDNDDIGSQMIYSLYKPINDYFNLNNVFNFGAIYDWFELNMFNGNAPLSIFIIWNIIVYEFIMDIIFLIYSVFMFVIDFATNTLDRFTGWAKRGD